FTSAAMNYSTVSELDKAYKYIAQKLSDDDELLAKATDVYSVLREELNETSMEPPPRRQERRTATKRGIYERCIR
ncbi:hypothetical protein O5965_24290, partial [Escherichia coli]|nr:hypothetical protein [Escherichia coli]